MSEVAVRDPQGPHNLVSLQLLRGAAAIFVVIHHTCLIIAVQPEYGGMNAYAWIANKGWIGVNCFFVLSGFIIMHAHSRDIGTPSRALRYVMRRVSRIYPIYWLFLTCFM